MTLNEVAMLNGEDMVRRYGNSALQQLIDLLVSALRRGDEDEARAIDNRIKEVESSLGR